MNKVLILNGSPHQHGCTATALDEMIKVFEEEGVGTELIQVGTKDIRGCISCNKCSETGKCVFDDLVNEVAPKLEEADGLVVGSPVYYNTASFDVLNKYFTISGMPVASSTYWNQVHGFTADDVKKDLEGLQTMRNLARNMSFMIKAFSDAKVKYGYPEVERGCFTSFPDGK